jgi:DNA polymerase III delta subunit
VRVAAQELRPVYLIGGSDEPKIALVVRRLRGRFAEGSVEHLLAEAASGADAVAATNALGLFGGGERLVIVEDVERWKKADVESVVAYLASPTPGAVLALLGNASKLEGLAEACARAGEVLRYDLPQRKVRGRQVDDYPAWVQGRFERAGVRVDRETAERLVEIVHEDALALESDVLKIATWAGGEPVGVAEVERLATPGGEDERSPALVNAWAARSPGEVLRACEHDLLGESEPFWISARIARHVSTVRGVQRLLRAGLGLTEIQKRLDLRFPPRREAGHAESRTAEELEASVVRLASLDHALKGGSRLDPVLELERALLEVTEPAAGAAGGSR